MCVRRVLHVAPDPVNKELGGTCAIYIGWQPPILRLIRIQLPGEAELLQIIQANCSLRITFPASQRTQKQRGQNANDSDHYQQLYQREGPASALRI